MSYGPHPGHPPPQHGPPAGHPGYPPVHPGHGPPPRYGPPSTAMAHLAAALFLICGVLALVTAIVSWDGSVDDVDLLVATVGFAFSDDVTGNIDFAVAATMTAACSTLTFALLLFARLDLVRWALGVIGGVVTVYYVYALIKLLSEDLGRFVAMVVVSLVLWAAATVLALLPATGRAMRGHQRKLAQYPPRPMGYPY